VRDGFHVLGLSRAAVTRSVTVSEAPASPAHIGTFCPHGSVLRPTTMQPERDLMRAAQVVQWTRSPALAIAADGCVVATNDACDRLIGLSSQAATDMHCWEVVKATDS